MEKLTPKEIAHMINGELLNDKETFVGRISTDTRELKPGDCFIALKGENHDGHDYLNQAITKGTSALIVEKFDPLSLAQVPPVIKVSCTFLALENLAKAYRAGFSTFFIGITGSLGKTTTKEIAAYLISQEKEVLKSEKSFNNNIGIPLTLLNLEKHHQVGVIEIGANDFGEIADLTSLVKPKIGVITCISHSHLEKFGSLAGVEKAKSEIVNGLIDKNTFITNADDPACRRIAKKFKGKVVTFGRLPEATYQARHIKVSQGCLEFTVAGVELKTFICGSHHLYNVLAGIAIAREVGVSWEKIANGLLSFSLPPMRMQIEKTNEVTIINDAYNANPDSMISAIETLSEFDGKRKVAILGDMLELGKNSESLHRKVGEAVAQKNIDELWVVGKLAYKIADGALAKGMPLNNVRCFPQKKSLVKRIERLIAFEDVVLLKASRKLQLETIAKQIRELALC